jgi:hypothetical protein
MMRILIGLFQQRQEIQKIITTKGIDPASLTEVGPFFSREQAVSWMQELHSRIESSEIALFPERGSEHLQWYGFTLEG